MTESGENKPSGQNTQIVLALIGLVGAVSTGVFTNWDKIFPATSAPPAAVESPSVTGATDSSATGNTGAVVESSAAASTNGNAASSEVNPSSADEVPAVANESIPQNLDLSGAWESPTLGTTEIKQDGNVVKGAYRTAEHYGVFEGTVVENRLDYRWWQDSKRKSSYEKAEVRGTGSFAIQDNGRKLAGSWTSETGTGGEWSLTKQD